jgi:uncharacterized protein (TIGR03118 family)
LTRASYLAVGALVAACTGDDVSRIAPLDASAVDSSMTGTDASNGDAGILVRVNRTDLVVDEGNGGAARVDPNLVNPWGLAISPSGSVWTVDNGRGLVTPYGPSGASSGTTIAISGPGGAGQGTPSGEVLNSTSGAFEGDTLIVATEDGTIAGWQSGATATLRVDESANGAVFKGADILESPTGRTLVVANFNAGTLEVFDSTYAPVALSPEAFADPGLTAGFAPFNVLVSGSNVFVAYAKQDAMKHDGEAGPGNGLIDVFDETGVFLRRLVTAGDLNSPWGLALAPADYSLLAGSLLVGNFGNGTILAFDPATGAPRGQLVDASGALFSLEGLWGLHFGQDQAMEAHTQLFFTAGPGDEAHGVFGRLDLAL